MTSDLAALDGEGWWAVVVDYEGKVTCARFDRVRRSPLPAPAAPWHGPRPGQWVSSLDQAAYERGVRAIRDYIEQGEVYQANLCRILTAPVRGTPTRSPWRPGWRPATPPRTRPSSTSPA
ncbi:hypothetical protein GCM10020220_036420 [Nonomuraea rubra]|uniref:hypothetical protein n=1 Tax=Nonomuraea rubra TaxID=46180 RepID=UPI0031EADBA1